MNNPADYAVRIRMAIAWAKSSGWKLAQGCTVSSLAKCCCPMGALGMMDGVDDDLYYLEVIAKKADMPADAAIDFSIGFDSDREAKSTDRPWVQLGKQIRDEQKAQGEDLIKRHALWETIQ